MMDTIVTDTHTHIHADKQLEGRREIERVVERRVVRIQFNAAAAAAAAAA